MQQCMIQHTLLSDVWGYFFLHAFILQDADLSRNMPGKVKVSAPNLLAAKKKWKVYTETLQVKGFQYFQQLNGTVTDLHLVVSVWMWTILILNIDCDHATICLNEKK